MAPTVGWLLTRPELGLRLVAGDAGAEREIRWVHATELENPGPWMSGGELVLTTGLRLPRTAQRRRAYVEHLDRAGAAGIGFGIECRTRRCPATSSPPPTTAGCRCWRCPSPRRSSPSPGR